MLCSYRLIFLGTWISDFITAYQALLYAMFKCEERYVGMKDSAKRFEWALEEAVKRSNEEECRRLLLEAEDVTYRTASGTPGVLCRVREVYPRLALSHHGDPGPFRSGPGDRWLRLASKGESGA